MKDRSFSLMRPARPVQLELGQVWEDGRARGPTLDEDSRLLRRPFGSQASRRSLRDCADSQEPLLEGFDAASFDVREWLKQAMRLEARWRSSEEIYRQYGEHAAKLTPDLVRSSRDAEALAALEGFLRACRYNHEWEFSRYFRKTRLGELIAETTNRGRQLALGRVEPRTKGPTLDPTRLPDEALERLIQTHRDMAVVEALRAERERRHGSS